MKCFILLRFRSCSSLERCQGWYLLKCTRFYIKRRHTVFNPMIGETFPNYSTSNIENSVYLEVCCVWKNFHFFNESAQCNEQTVSNAVENTLIIWTIFEVTQIEMLYKKWAQHGIYLLNSFHWYFELDDSVRNILFISRGFELADKNITVYQTLRRCGTKISIIIVQLMFRYICKKCKDSPAKRNENVHSWNG